MSNTQATQPFRTRPVMLSSAVYDACKVLGELEGNTCVDEFVDVLLGVTLSNRAQIPWAVAEWKKRREKFKEDYRAKISEAEDQLS